MPSNSSVRLAVLHSVAVPLFCFFLWPQNNSSKHRSGFAWEPSLRHARRVSFFFLCRNGTINEK
ncbi:hypothetical protein EDC32_101114 [Laceyella sacchari]|nr:hypothetical protein EDC32_101114 [Laceyella sacchari]